MTIHDLASRLNNVQQHGSYYTASCPCTQNHSNGDKHQSLSFRQEQGGKILIHCLTGCSFEEICAALNARPSDFMGEDNAPAPAPTKRKPFASEASYIRYLETDKKLGKVEAIYNYCYGPYHDGLKKLKIRKPDGDKEYRWYVEQDDGKVIPGKNDCAHRLYLRGDPNETAVFLVEGEKDCDNLHQLTGYTCVSAEDGGAKKNVGDKWREEYNAQLEGKAVYVLKDNDETGENFAKAECEAISGRAAYIFTLDLRHMWPEVVDFEHGDISDAIADINDDDQARGRFNLMLNMCQVYTPEKPGLVTDSAAAVDVLMAKAETELYKPTPTGIAEIDSILAGGIFPQTIITLGAWPGAGKTILATQIAEGMARSGRARIAYFNLEMSTEQLIARSLSRETGYSALTILQGYKWTDEQRAKITMAANKYKREIAPNIVYNPGSGSAVYQEILAEMQRQVKTGDTSLPFIAFIDYLQLLRSADGKGDDVETIKAALTAFKGFAMRENAAVVLIMAHSRAVNNSGQAVQGAGRDTSAIEYSGDTQLSLNYTKIVDGTFPNLEKMDEAIREKKANEKLKGIATSKLYALRSVVVTKNRFVESGNSTRADLLFMGEESRFAMIDKRH